MPCDCEIDLVRRRVRCRAWGTVTFEEGMAVRTKFTSDPDFKPDFSQIFDFADCSRLAVTASEIGLLARDDVFGRGSRRAMVAPRIDLYGFGRTFQLYRQINAGKEQIKLFRTLEEAEAWLNSNE